jgi:hypothetical protein
MLDERPTGTTCSNCGIQTADPHREGWHVFEDGLDEQHALCRRCTSGSRPSASARPEQPGGGER